MSMTLSSNEPKKWYKLEGSVSGGAGVPCDEE